MKFFYLLVLSVYLIQTVLGDYDYCREAGPEHTMCKYQGVAENCTNSRYGGFTLEQKREMLRAHNYFRNKVAGGLETLGSPGPQPGAVRMVKMYWSNAVEEVAQRISDQCIYAHDCSACRSVYGYSSGQNLLTAGVNERYNEVLNITRMVERWYEEVELYDRADVTRWRFIYETGHYTQIVWEDSYFLGCGARDWEVASHYRGVFVFCNYTPAGNGGRSVMYYTGDPASHCYTGTTAGGDPEFPYLCSIDHYEEQLAADPNIQFGESREE